MIDQAEARSTPDLAIPGDTEERSVLTWLAEAKRERERQSRLIDEAEIRERIVMGEQFLSRERDSSTNDIFSDIASSSTTPITENRLYSLCLTWSSRVNQGRVEAMAYPFQAERGDVLAARASNMILDYEEQRQDEQGMINRAGLLTQMHGDALFYPLWVESDGPHKVLRQKSDDLGPMFAAAGQPLMEEAWEYGGMREEVIAAPDYWTSGEEHYDKASYLVVRRLISTSTAKRLLRSIGFDAKSLPEQSIENVTGVSRRGVEAFEVWVKPGDDMQDGMFALVVADHVIRVTPYPYDHGELPGAVWKCGMLRGSPRGKTHVSDAIHQQRLINRALASILVRAKAAAWCRLVGPSSVTGSVDANPLGLISIDTDRTKERVFFLEGAEIPSSLMAVYERAIRALHDVFGVSPETATGGDPTESKSGKQMRIAEQLDAQKLTPAREALEKCRERCRRQWLALWQQFAETARLVRVIGPDGAVSANHFRGADLQGADVRLEPSSGLATNRLASQREAEELGAAQLISPAEALERRTTGLPSAVGPTDALARVDAQARAALSGQPQQPLPDVEPKLAVARLRDHVSQASRAPGGTNAVKALFDLIDAYEEAAKMKAQQTQAMQQQQGQQPEQPGARVSGGRAQTKVQPTDMAKAKAPMPTEQQQ